MITKTHDCSKTTKWNIKRMTTMNCTKKELLLILKKENTIILFKNIVKIEQY